MLFLTRIKLVSGQLGQISIDDLILGAVGIGAANVQPRPIPDRLNDPDVVSTIVISTFAFGDAVSNVGGFHVD